MTCLSCKRLCTSKAGTLCCCKLTLVLDTPDALCPEDGGWHH